VPAKLQQQESAQNQRGIKQPQKKAKGSAGKKNNQIL
jgi:hypothetical protein